MLRLTPTPTKMPENRSAGLKDRVNPVYKAPIIPLISQTRRSLFIFSFTWSLIFIVSLFM